MLLQTNMGFRIEGYENDLISDTIKNTGVWEPQIASIIKEWNTGGIFLDLGCFIGHHSLLASKYYDKVYAFDMNKEAILKLNKSISINNIENIYTVSTGLGKIAKKNIYYGFDKNNTGECTIRKNKTKYKSTLNTLDSYRLYKEDIGMIKMDLEGWELDTIMGGKRTFKKASMLIIEVSRTFLEREDIESYLNILHGFRFKFVILHDITFGKKLASVSEVLKETDKVKQFNILCYK